MHGAVAFLLDHLPPTLHLVVASREDPVAALVVEQSTVKSHLNHVYSELGLHSRTQAVARAPRLLG